MTLWFPTLKYANAILAFFLWLEYASGLPVLSFRICLAPKRKTFRPRPGALSCQIVKRPGCMARPKRASKKTICQMQQILDCVGIQS